MYIMGKPKNISNSKGVTIMEKIENNEVVEVKEESKFISKLKSSKKYLKYAGIGAVSVIAGILIGRATSNGSDESCDYSDDSNVECSVDDSSSED